MSSVVLDASALLAVLQGEKGAEQVVPKLKDSTMSAVNYSEVLKKLIERGEDVGVSIRNIESMQVVVKDFDKVHARRTAVLWPATKKHGLSLGDRACLALGDMLNAEILTTDNQMAATNLPVKVKLLRKRNDG